MRRIREKVDGFDIALEREGDGWNADVLIGPDTWALFAQDEGDGWTCWGFSSGHSIFAQHPSRLLDKVPDCPLRAALDKAVDRHAA